MANKWLLGQPVQTDETNNEWFLGQPYVIRTYVGIVQVLTGTITVQSAVSGAILVSKRVTGTIVVQSSVTGDLSCSRLLISTITNVSTISGKLATVGNFSNYVEDELLDHITGKTSFDKPTVYVGLCTDSPGEAGTGAAANEVANSHNYARVATIADTWNAASGGSIDNAEDITFPEASGSWGPVNYYALFDSGIYGEGNMLIHDVLDNPVNVIAGHSVQFAAGELVLTLS